MRVRSRDHIVPSLTAYAVVVFARKVVHLAQHTIATVNAGIMCAEGERRKEKSELPELNQRPLDLQSNALPTELSSVCLAFLPRHFEIPLSECSWNCAISLALCIVLQLYILRNTTKAIPDSLITVCVM